MSTFPITSFLILSSLFPTNRKIHAFTASIQNLLATYWWCCCWSILVVYVVVVFIIIFVVVVHQTSFSDVLRSTSKHQKTHYDARKEISSSTVPLLWRLVLWRHDHNVLGDVNLLISPDTLLILLTLEPPTTRHVGKQNTLEDQICVIAILPLPRLIFG